MSGRLLLMSATVFASFAAAARADYVLYSLPLKTDNAILEFVFEGEAHTHPRTIELQHPKYGTLVFGRQLAKAFETESVRKRLEREMLQAYEKQDATKLLSLGREALRKGYLVAHYNAAIATLEFAPDHPQAKAIVELKQQIDEEPTDAEAAEAELRKIVPIPEMKVARSKHFLMLHDLDAPKKRGEKGRADERLELMEKVYESFLNFFAARGAKLDPPRKLLKSVVFRHQRDFDAFYRDEKGQDIYRVAGVYNIKLDVSFFFEHASLREFTELQSLTADLNALAKDARRYNLQGRAELMRFVKMIDVLVQVERENEDIESVSHEVTHQMAVSTGLLPKDAAIPLWVHEGLATYFEAPREATWSGIGAVNAERLATFREARDQQRSLPTIERVVSDRVFSSPEDMLAAYGQSWALTHFLMENHFDSLIRYYRLLASVPKERATEDSVVAAFDRVFLPADREGLTTQWRLYTNRLKTDIEQAVGRDIRQAGRRSRDDRSQTTRRRQ